MQKITAKKGLYAITPDQKDSALLFSQVEQALKGGIALLQYRDKISSASEKLARAKTLHSLCQQHRVPFIINDSAELALACQAEGVHLGQGDGTIQQARQLLGHDAIIGITCHHQLELAIQAEKDGADYVAFGRFFPSNTKPGLALASLALLANAKEALALPVVAIGGIKQTNAKNLISNNVDYIAVIDQVFSAPNIKERCHSFSSLFIAQ